MKNGNNTSTSQHLSPKHPHQCPPHFTFTDLYYYVLHNNYPHYTKHGRIFLSIILYIISEQLGCCVGSRTFCVPSYELRYVPEVRKFLCPGFLTIKVVPMIRLIPSTVAWCLLIQYMVFVVLCFVCCYVR